MSQLFKFEVLEFESVFADSVGSDACSARSDASSARNDASSTRSDAGSDDEEYDSGSSPGESEKTIVAAVKVR